MKYFALVAIVAAVVIVVVAAATASIIFVVVVLVAAAVLRWQPTLTKGMTKATMPTPHAGGA